MINLFKMTFDCNPFVIYTYYLCNVGSRNETAIRQQDITIIT